MSIAQYEKAPVLDLNKQLLKGDGKRAYRRFESLDEYSVVPPMSAANRKLLVRTISSFEDRSLSWYGVEGGADKVLDLIKNGWPEGVQRMNEAFSQLTTSLEAVSLRRVLTRGDHGDEFDIHRANSGNLDKSWSRRKRGKRPASRSVSIFLNGSVAYNVHANTLFWRGAAILCLTDILSTAGYSVEVSTGGASIGLQAEGKQSYLGEAVILKAASDPVNLTNLAAGLCLGINRVIGFARSASVPYPIDYSFGQPSFADLEPLGLPASTIKLEGPAIQNQQQANDWVTSTLAKIESGEIEL